MKSLICKLKNMGRNSKGCPRFFVWIQHSFKIFWVMTLLLCLISGTIKLSVWFALKNDEAKILVDFIPVIKEMVWPVFWLIVIVLFLRQLSVTMAALPSMVKRSYLPYSPQPLKNTDLKELINPSLNSVIDVVDQNEDKSLPKHCDFNEENHKEKVKQLLEVLSKEFGVDVVLEARIAESSWRTDGAFMLESRCYYVAVLPYVFKDRVKSVVEKVNELLLARKHSAADFSLMICIYDCENSDVSEFLHLRREAKFSIVFRAWAKEI